MILEASSGRRIELDPRLSDAELADNLGAPDATAQASPARGRPKLGVVAREITLLPRQWEWLGRQRGGASAMLRRLVDDAARASRDTDRRRHAQEAIHRFITILAGDEPGYEEAVRALFAGDPARFEHQISNWPPDIRVHVAELADAAFAAPTSLQRHLPADRLGPATTALERIFGPDKRFEIEPLGGRSGATVLKICAGSASAVLRFDVAPDGFRNPARHYACQAIAAQAGVAPELLHVDVPMRLSISAFIGPAPAPTGEEWLTAIATALSKLHAAPLFPPLMPFMDAMDQLIGAFTGAEMLTRDQADRVRTLFEELRSVYQLRDGDLVSSHNDLNPTNLLFAGGKAFFVDWETAFAADRYVDLAAVVNFLARNEADERLILGTYFGRRPTEEECRRLGVMRQVSRLYYGVMLLGAAHRVHPDLALAASALDLASYGDSDAQPAHPIYEVHLGCKFLADALRAAAPAR